MDAWLKTYLNSANSNLYFNSKPKAQKPFRENKMASFFGQVSRYRGEPILFHEYNRMNANYCFQTTPRTPDAAPVPSAILAQQASLHKFPALVPDQQESPMVKIKYEAAVAPPPPPAPPTPKPKLTDEDWERIK